MKRERKHIGEKEYSVNRRELIVGGVALAGVIALTGANVFEASAEELSISKGVKKMPGVEVSIYLKSGGIAKTILQGTAGKGAISEKISSFIASPSASPLILQGTNAAIHILKARAEEIVGWSVEDKP